VEKTSYSILSTSRRRTNKLGNLKDTPNMRQRGAATEHTYPVVLEEDVTPGFSIVRGGGDRRRHVILRVQLDDHTVLLLK